MVKKNFEDWFVRILSPISLSHLGCAFSFSPNLSQDSRCPLSPGAPPWTRGCRASPCWRSPCRPSGGSTRTRLSHSPAPCLSSASCSAESNFHSYPMGEMNLIAICVDVEMKITGKYIADWYLRLLLELLCDPNQKLWSPRIKTLDKNTQHQLAGNIFFLCSFVENSPIIMVYDLAGFPWDKEVCFVSFVGTWIPRLCISGAGLFHRLLSSWAPPQLSSGGGDQVSRSSKTASTLARLQVTGTRFKPPLPPPSYFG